MCPYSRPLPFRVAIWFLAFLQLLGLLTARADGEWQPQFSIRDLNLSPYGTVVVSERQGALFRTDLGSDEIILQDYRTGETNQVLRMPAGVFRMALSPNHQWLYVALFHPSGVQGGVDTNILEFDLVSPGEPRVIPVPDRLVNLVATDDRLVVLNVEGTSDSGPYRLRVLNAVNGQLGPYAPVSSFVLAPAVEQDSVFAFNFVAAATEDTFRHRFDRTTLSWTGRRRFPVIPGEAGAPHGLPFGYMPDRRLLLTPFGVYTNLPNDAAGDLRRLAPLDLGGPQAVFLDPRAPKFCLVASQGGIRLVRTDRWESTLSYPPMPGANLGALAYGGDGEGIVGVFVGSTEADGRVLRFRPPWGMLATNGAPAAQLHVVPAGLTTAEPVRLDAGASTDDLTAQARLRYRWDLDGDGRFEIPFTNSPVLVHRFDRVGPVRVQVEVEDELGERAQAAVTVEVAYAAVPATPLSPGTPWEYDFGIVAAVFDLPRNRLLAVDAGGHRIVEIATDSGQATREFRVESVMAPTALALSSDGRHLYCVEVHGRPLLPPDPDNAYVVQFDLEAGVRAREVSLGKYTSGLAVLPDQHVASMTGTRLEIRRWPDAAPTAWAGIGTFPTALLAGMMDGSLYWAQNFDATLNLRRVKFDAANGAVSTPTVASTLAVQAHVFGNGRHLLLNTGQVRSLTPGLPTDFALVTNLVVEPFRQVVDLSARQLFGLRGDGHWEFRRTSDWSRLVIQSAPQGAFHSFAAADAQHLLEIRHPDARGFTTLERRRLPSTDPGNNQAPVLSWETPPGLIQLGSNVVVTGFAFDEDGVVAGQELLVNGEVVPALPDTFPGVPGRRQWRWTPAVHGIYRLQLVARDNLGVESRLPEHLVRVNQAPTVDFALPFSGSQETPISFEFEVVADDVDDRVVQVDAAYTSSSGRVRFLGSLTQAPYRFQVDRLVGQRGVLAVTVTDETGAKGSKVVNLQLVPPPGDNFVKPLPLEGAEVTTGYAARQMHSDAIPYVEPPDSTVGQGTGGVWWRWTAPADVVVQIDTLGSSFDTLLRVVDTNRFPRIIQESDDDPLMIPASRVKFPANAGEVFLIGVLAEYTGDSGDIRLNLRTSPWVKPPSAPAPTNDLFSGRTILETGVKVLGTTVGARREGQETLRGSRETNTVWYRWTAPETGWAQMEVTSTNMDPVLTLYLDGTSILRLRRVATKDDNSLTDTSATMVVPVVAGTTYVLRVHGIGPVEGEFHLVVRSPVDAPGGTNSPHDRLGLARVLSGDLVGFSGSSRTATADAAMQEALNLTGPVNGVWWRWTPDVDGHVHWSVESVAGISETLLVRRAITLDAAGVPHVVAGSIPNLHRTVLQWPTVAGTTYYLFVGTEVSRPAADFGLFLNHHMQAAPLLLDAPDVGVDGSLRVGLRSPFERRATVEMSDDLRQWNSVRPVVVPAGRMTLELPEGAVGGTGFFRLRSED